MVNSQTCRTASSAESVQKRRSRSIGSMVWRAARRSRRKSSRGCQNSRPGEVQMAEALEQLQEDADGPAQLEAALLRALQEADFLGRAGDLAPLALTGRLGTRGCGFVHAAVPCAG